MQSRTTTDCAGSSNFQIRLSTAISNACHFPAPGSLTQMLKRLHGLLLRYRIRSLVFGPIKVDTTEIAAINTDSGLVLTENASAVSHSTTDVGNASMGKVILHAFITLLTRNTCRQQPFTRII